MPPGFVPEPYRELQGEKAFQQTISGMIALAGRKNIPLIIFDRHPMRPEQFTIDGVSLLAGHPSGNVYCADVSPAIKRYLEANGYPALMGSPLTLSAVDMHPSPLGHVFLANELFRFLSEKGLINRMLSAASQRKK